MPKNDGISIETSDIPHYYFGLPISEGLTTYDDMTKWRHTLSDIENMHKIIKVRNDIEKKCMAKEMKKNDSSKTLTYESYF